MYSVMLTLQFASMTELGDSQIAKMQYILQSQCKGQGHV